MNQQITEKKIQCPRCLCYDCFKIDSQQREVCTTPKCPFINTLRIETRDNETNNYDNDIDRKQENRAILNVDNPIFQNQQIEFSGKGQEDVNKQINDTNKIEEKQKKLYDDYLQKVNLLGKAINLHQKLIESGKMCYNEIMIYLKNQKINKIDYKSFSVAALQKVFQDQDQQKFFQNKLPQLLKIIGVTNEQYTKSCDKIKSILDDPYTTQEYGQIYAKQLQMNEEEKQAVKDIIQNIDNKQLYEGQRSETKASAAVYIVCQLSDRAILNLKSIRDISQISEMGEVTIKRYYDRHLFPRRFDICPKYPNLRSADCLKQ